MEIVKINTKAFKHTEEGWMVATRVQVPSSNHDVTMYTKLNPLVDFDDPKNKKNLESLCLQSAARAAEMLVIKEYIKKGFQERESNAD